MFFRKLYGIAIVNEKWLTHNVFPVNGIFIINREPPQRFCSSEPLPLWNGPPAHGQWPGASPSWFLAALPIGHKELIITSSSPVPGSVPTFLLMVTANPLSVPRDSYCHVGDQRQVPPGWATWERRLFWAKKTIKTQEILESSLPPPQQPKRIQTEDLFWEECYHYRQLHYDVN